MHVLIDDDLHGAQENGTVRGGPQRHPVVGSIGGGVILGRDDHDPGAPFDTFQLPVGFRHLVLDEVLAPAGVQLGEAHVGEVDVGPLGPAPPGVGRVLVPVPGIVRPIAAPLGLIRADLPDPGVQQRVDAPVHASVPHLAEDAEDRHAGAMFETAGAGPLHHLDHLRRIPLLPEPPGAGFPAVPRGDDDHGLGSIGKGRIPGDAQHVIEEAAVELILALRLRRQLRRARVHPLLPALPHHRAFQPIGTVYTAVKGVPLQAHARVMCKGPAVAVEVFIGLVVVVLLDPHHDAVPDEGPDAAGVRVVRGTDPGERRVVPILVVIDPLPGPIRIVPQRVADFDDRLQRRQRQHLVRHGHGRDRAG